MFLTVTNLELNPISYDISGDQLTIINYFGESEIKNNWKSSVGELTPRFWFSNWGVVQFTEFSTRGRDALATPTGYLGQPAACLGLGTES